jgi:hypothetical protein
MSPIEKVPAKYFFAELLLPLKHANSRKNIHYMRLRSSESSTWEPVSSRTGGMEKVSASNCSATALLNSLSVHWGNQSESDLIKFLPYLMALREELMEQRPLKDETNGRVPDFVYPLF